jgi:hypothetical protein
MCHARATGGRASCKGSENPALLKITIRSGAGLLSSIEYRDNVKDNDDDE